MYKKFFQKKAKLIESTNPDRIYIENIRSFFNVSTHFAKFLCETAVKRGYFEKKIAVECLNKDCKRIIKVFNSMDELPNELICIVCEEEGKETFTFEKQEYRIVEFYKLVKNEYN